MEHDAATPGEDELVEAAQRNTPDAFDSTRELLHHWHANRFAST
jgi:hypothetical protein